MYVSLTGMVGESCVFPCKLLSNQQVEILLSGNTVWLINEVTQRRARLVLRWVTVHGYTVSAFNQATQANSAWPSLRG